jgi:Peptidase M50B-like
MFSRLPQAILIVSTLVGCWLAMQDVHELGHVLGAWATGGRVARVVLDPRTISRTDLVENPHPLVVVWAGPIGGVVMPLALWGLVALFRFRGAFVFRFFAGFCLIANGLYIGGGSFGRVGDCGDMLRHGSPIWMLWLFGLVAVPLGFALWNGLGPAFGLGAGCGKVDRAVAIGAFVVGIVLVTIGFVVGG